MSSSDDERRASGPIDGDDPLAGIDLDAWQPPPLRGGLADAVVQRMREPAAVTPHELGERGGGRGAGWMIGGALVAAGLVTGLVVAGSLGGRRSEPIAPGPIAPGPADPGPPAAAGDRGDVVAERASHLELGDSSAELDAGAELTWQRDGARVSIVQRRGSATWRAGRADTLVIDAGAMGASVEASGASLRVEVHMQLSSSDARVVAASVATAAVVSLVTVIVYQGHVKASSASQTVNVGAGSAVEIKPGEPPRDVRDVAGGPGRTVARTGGELEPPRDIAPSALDALRLTGDKNIMPDEAEKLAIQSASRFTGEAAVIASAKLCIDPTGRVTSVRLLKSTGYPGYDQKIQTQILGWQYRPYEVDGKAVAVCTAVTFVYEQQ